MHTKVFFLEQWLWFRLFFPDMQIPQFRTASSLPEGDTVWRRCISLINRSLRNLLHTFICSIWVCFWANICLLMYCSQVFLLSGFPDGSVIVFVMCAYHNMKPGCRWQLLIYGPWSQWVSQIPPLTFVQQALNVSCCEMKATLTSHHGQLCFLSLVWVVVDDTQVIFQENLKLADEMCWGNCMMVC